jgi:capsular exopolysaccharide synthesis family protein
MAVHESAEKTDLRSYLSIFMRRRWLMLAVFAVVLAIGMLYTRTRRPIYESSAKIIVISKTASIPTSDDDLPFMSDIQALTRTRSADTQVEVLSSRDLLDEAFNKLAPSLRMKGFGEDSLPGWAYSVDAKKNTDLIALTTRAYDPVAAAKLANSIADTYFRRDLQQNNQAIRQAREFAEAKMAIASKDLARANLELSVFKRKTGLFAPDIQMGKTAERMAQLTLDADDASAQLASSQKSIRSLRAELAAQREHVVTDTTLSSNPQFMSMLDSIDKLNAERASLLEEYTPESKEVRSMDGRIKRAESQLKRVSQSIVSSTIHSRNPVRDSLLTTYATSVADLSAASARKSALAAELENCKAAVKDLPERERGYEELLQRATLLQKTYEMLSSKYYSLVLSEQATLPNGLLAAGARVPGGPAYPDPKRNAALSIILGAMLAVGAAFLAEGLDSRVHSELGVEEITGSNTLSMIPLVVGASPNLANNRSDSALFESFRILRNNILYAPAGEQVKVLAVTSPGRGDGKTTTSANLATSMAIGGKRVLLVDCDFRRPALHELLKISNEIGLSSVLSGAAALEKAIVPTAQKDLYCLPSGQSASDSIEILGHESAVALFKELAGKFDVVLADCAPCVGLGDMQVISRLVDGVVLVISLEYTHTPQLQMAVRGLSQSATPLIGLVLNRINQHHHGYHYDYSYADYTENDTGIAS